MKRRRFLGEAARSAVLTAGALSLARRPILAADSGPTSTIGIGVIGCGGRGRSLLDYFRKRSDAEVRAVCDVYEPRLKAAQAAASPDAAPYADHKALLERKEVEAVVIATPDHWHARMVIDAVEAGKDVYVEKPLCHTVEEGFQVVEAVRRTGRVVQVGTQRRSYTLFLEGKKVFDEGRCGKVRLVTAWWYNTQGPLTAGKLEGRLDWEKWLGPAPRRPLDEVRFQNWYHFYEYSGGLTVGQGAHVIDAINMLMGTGFPTAATAAATRPHVEGAEVPETTSMSLEYGEEFLAVFTLNYAGMQYLPPHDLHKQFHGSTGRFDIGRESFALYPAQLERRLEPTAKREMFGSFPEATAEHIANFIDCCRSRKDPNATVEMGNHASVALSMALESIRTGRRIRFDSATRKMSAG